MISLHGNALANMSTDMPACATRQFHQPSSVRQWHLSTEIVLLVVDFKAGTEPIEVRYAGGELHRGHRE